MIKLIFLLLPLAGAYFGEPLKVQNIVIEKSSDQPSCRMLNFRKLEREKVLREIVRSYSNDLNNSLKSIILKDQFLTNQYFLDLSIWQDPGVKILMQVQMSEELKKTSREIGFKNIFLSFKSTGIYWSSLLNQIPNSIEAQLNDDGESFILSYYIYKVDYCNKPNLDVEVSWLHPDDDIGTRFDNYKTIMNADDSNLLDQPTSIKKGG